MSAFPLSFRGGGQGEGAVMCGFALPLSQASPHEGRGL